MLACLPFILCLKKKNLLHIVHMKREKKEKVFAKLFGHNFLHGALAFC